MSPYSIGFAPHHKQYQNKHPKNRDKPDLMILVMTLSQGKDLEERRFSDQV